MYKVVSFCLVPQLSRPLSSVCVSCKRYFMCIQTVLKMFGAAFRKELEFNLYERKFLLFGTVVIEYLNF